MALRLGSTNLGPDFMRRCLASAREYAKGVAWEEDEDVQVKVGAGFKRR